MKRCRRPTRPLLLIALLLLAGAVVNVAVAWGIAGLGAEQPRGGSWAPRTSRFQAPVWHIRRGQAAHQVWTAQWTVGYWVCMEFDLADLDSYTLAFGWPRPSLRVRDPLHRERELPAHARLVSAGFFERSDGLIPIDPISRGFAINTLFYTAILALPLSVFPIRRRLRARRGRCPKCGYDLAGVGSQPCPECGASRRRAGPIPQAEGLERK